MDLIDQFLDYTESFQSPRLFRLWSGISLVAGACERRIWTRVGDKMTFPNLYVLLVAPPAVGKFVVEEVRELWTDTKDFTGAPAFKVAPDSVTKASLIDVLAKAKKQFMPGAGAPLEYNSLLVGAEEFGVLMPNYDIEYISTLNRIYNNVNKHSEERRTGSVREVTITKPQLNILSGVQPGWLGSVFPEEAWSTGLASRINMVYCSEGPLVDPFARAPNIRAEREAMLEALSRLAKRYGELKWEPEAAQWISDWHMSGAPPLPQHSKLQDYNRRRTLHLLKLSTISAVAANAPHIRLADVERARGWLFECEVLIPDIFRAMVGKSDQQVLDELHFYMLGVFRMHQGKPIREQAVYSFLMQRVPSDKIPRLIETAERSSLIERVAGTGGDGIPAQYKPKPKHEHGVE